MKLRTLKQLAFENSYSKLPNNFFQFVNPQGIRNPFLIDFNEQVADLIQLCPEQKKDADFLTTLSGNRLLADSTPIAAVYSGHQFGYYVPQLGDGRAILLSEIIADNGSRWDLQLKGAGVTAFSRQGDGRAVLRSTIREYLCSEAMHNLGIPTTRALCIIGSETDVYREKVEKAAVLTRIAPSHIRFGTLQYFYHTNQHDSVRILADYLIEHHYSALLNSPTKYETLFETIVIRTAKLMAQWQSVGFAHGVMNTDNMSVLGLTMDYGPFGFLDGYDPSYICNHTDQQGRYAFGQQPNIGLWNLTCLAEAFTPLISIDSAKTALDQYESSYSNAYIDIMLKKLGFIEYQPQHLSLLKDLLLQMEQSSVDYTNFFRNLSSNTDEQQLEFRRNSFIDRQAFDNWTKDYDTALKIEKLPAQIRQSNMNSVNPKYILRNHLAQIAIEKAEDGNYDEVINLRKILTNPFDEQIEFEQYAKLPPEWAKGIEISCSS